jgi:peptide/nickel transport system permease protein
VLYIVLTGVFIMVHLIGDPALLLVPASASPQQIATVRQQLGLNAPILTQYWHFVSGAVHGSFGTSYWMKIPALPVAWHRLVPSLVLGATAMVLALVVGLGLALAAAASRKDTLEQVVSVISFGVVAIVDFWAGLLLIYFFAVKLGWVPTTGYSALGLILPAIVVSLRAIGRIAQFTLESLKAELAKPYPRAAIARGVPRWRVVSRHCLRNVSVPLVTLTGNELIQAISSIAIIEFVFAWPGEGQLMLLAIQNRDLPMVISCVFMFTVVVVLINFAVDMLYGLLDRRARVA